MAKLTINPRKKASQKRSKETVKAILDATAHIIEEEDLDKLNTNIVALEAGVSIGSLYQYFPSKESILAELINRELRKNLDKVKVKIEAISIDQKIDEFVFELIDTISTLFKRKRRLRLFLFNKLPRGLMTEVHEIEDEIQSIVFNKLKEFKFGFTDHELNLKTYIIIHSFVGLMHGTLAKGRKIKEEDLRNEIKKLVINQLSS